jgi:Holliday junction DNA helicase RuvA
MISSLKGRINRIWGNNVEVEVNGVGYWVKVGNRMAKGLKEGEEKKLQTFMTVSENDVSLFGFENWEEVELFRLLISVSGVGPKTGAMILGEATAAEVIKAIGDADVGFFSKIKGLGKKTAQKIIIELKSKIGGLGELDLSQNLPLMEDDLFMSLKQLGFGRSEIEKVMSRMPMDLATLEEKLSWCLRELG